MILNQKTGEYAEDPFVKSKYPHTKEIKIETKQNDL
jgi:hypothetical protein